MLALVDFFGVELDLIGLIGEKRVPDWWASLLDNLRGLWIVEEANSGAPKVPKETS
jgi:hypothetical protein